MKIEIYEKGIFQIIRFSGPVKAIAQLEELQALIELYLRHGRVNIAVIFTDTSYLYSGAIAVLVQCYKKTSEKGGRLCIVEPNRDLLALLEQMNIPSVIDVFDSEDALPTFERGDTSTEDKVKDSPD
ncbi:MAG: STAS domain-containing protein [Chitinivibrionales bacterium]|nr:STAS domain-containing protein [Chitinivibrionales bacterium]MBD3357548.1 STAS domain-containing protein [Chitinivibrionales bacterium]